MNFRKATATGVLILMAVYSTYGVVEHLKDSGHSETGLQSVSILDVSDSKVVSNCKDKLEEHMVQGYNDALKSNDATVGWIHVEDTRIDYPIMSGDNNFYLNYNSSKQPSKAGSIFLDDSEWCIGQLSLVHGHNMLNGSMFSHIRKYTDYEFFKSHPIYIYDGTSVRKYQPLGFLKVPSSTRVEGELTDKVQIQKYAQSLVNKSMYGRKEVSTEPVLIINTCVSDAANNHYLLVSQEVDF